MERKGIAGLLLIPVVVVALLVMVNGAVANGITWAQASSGQAKNESVLIAVGLTLGAAVVAIVGTALVLCLTTGREVWKSGQVARSATELKEKLERVEPGRRRFILLLSAPGFLALDLGLGYLSWAVAVGNLSILSAESRSPLLLPALVGLILTVLGMICLVALQLRYVRWALKGGGLRGTSLPE